MLVSDIILRLCVLVACYENTAMQKWSLTTFECEEGTTRGSAEAYCIEGREAVVRAKAKVCRT